MIKKICLITLLFTALYFGLRIFHMIHHLWEDPALWQIRGVPLKFFFRLTALVLCLILITTKKIWNRCFVFLLVFYLWLPSVGFASRCQEARELLDKSGIARDANENVFGGIKIQPPSSSFPQDMDKITWWGAFKPFDFWESPKLQAVWINPQGIETSRQEFRGGQCALAKNTVRGENQLQGQFQPGVWKVIVTCDDYLIDRQTFAVLPAAGYSPSNPADGTKSKETPIMIWAKDKT